jgi:hypothetical protein
MPEKERKKLNNETTLQVLLQVPPSGRPTAAAAARS